MNLAVIVPSSASKLFGPLHGLAYAHVARVPVWLTGCAVAAALRPGPGVPFGPSQGAVWREGDYDWLYVPLDPPHHY